MERVENKMVIVMRADLGMPEGKLVAQGSHAALGTVLKIQKEGTDEQRKILEGWLSNEFTKVALRVDSHEQLLKIFEKAKKKGLATVLITDNGHTVFNGVKTDTCIGILGSSKEIRRITGHLKLL